ncbi:glycosyltransferase [Cupriavidus sp. P-10]|uniref:CgeB family protein n=1 Tax=unclassified Cupriavidus TaxID=2640874 RepID=UPI000E2F5E14|nr:glycosyltransferase [Cupriavidus sp. P-10]BDB25192.1 glycosyltransferase [Cupriavidus sp. P-10]
MNNDIKVLVCSASPDRVNHNAVLRNYVARGFEGVLQPGHVIATSLDSAVESAKRFRPDLIVVFGSCMPDSCDYTGLRTYCARSGASLVFWLHDDPYEFDFNYKIYRYADMIFSNDRWAAQHFDHPRVGHLPLAADRDAHFRPVGQDIARDVFFCGVGFPNRRQLVADCVPLLGNFKVEILGAEWDTALPFCRNERVHNEALPDLYASSRVTLNIGRRYNLANSRYSLDASTPGPRTFEAAMAGAVQCTYFEGPELLDHFDVGSEMLIFDSPAELAELVESMAGEPERRRSIAQAAQDRALRDHTYEARARSMLASLQ